jgi:hypothetical protein
MGGGLTGGGIVIIPSITNTARDSFFLRGIPSVRLMGPNGKALNLAQIPAGTDVSDLVLLTPGATTSVAMEWGDWCGPTPDVISVQVTLPSGGGTHTVGPGTPGAFSIVPRCPAVEGGSTPPGTRVGGSLGLLSSGYGEDGPPAPWRQLTLGILNAPSTVAAGQTLDYEVALSSPAALPVSLAMCPDYLQSLQRPSTAVVSGEFRLNCAAVVGYRPTPS